MGSESSYLASEQLNLGPVGTFLEASAPACLIAQLMLQTGGHLLLLDEPTEQYDIPTLENSRKVLY